MVIYFLSERLQTDHALWNRPEVRALVSRHQEELRVAGVTNSYERNLWFSAVFGNKWDKDHPSSSGINRSFAIQQSEAVASDNPLLVARKKGGWKTDEVDKPHDTLTFYKLDLDTYKPMPMSISYWVAEVAPDDGEVFAVQSLFYSPEQATLLMKQPRELAERGVLANLLTPFELT